MKKTVYTTIEGFLVEIEKHESGLVEGYVYLGFKGGKGGGVFKSSIWNIQKTGSLEDDRGNLFKLLDEQVSKIVSWAKLNGY